MGVPRRILIVLTAEPAGPIGSGALDPDGAAAVERLDTPFEDLLRRHGGKRACEDEDERFLARFSRAPDALAFALDVQVAVRQRRTGGLRDGFVQNLSIREITQ
jgi:hypothetical protein